MMIDMEGMSGTSQQAFVQLLNNSFKQHSNYLMKATSEGSYGFEPVSISVRSKDYFSAREPKALQLKVKR